MNCLVSLSKFLCKTFFFKFKFLRVNTTGDWATIQVIDLRYNPWACECKNQWMIDTLIPQIMKDNEPLTQNLV